MSKGMQADTHRLSAGTDHLHENPDSDLSELEPSALLELLGDEYTQKVLRSVADRPRSGREVAEDKSISRATAFRRLNELVDAGLVTTEMVPDPDGHHHKQFHAVFARVGLQFGDDGLSMDVERRTNQQSRSTASSYGYRLAND